MQGDLPSETQVDLLRPRSDPQEASSTLLSSSVSSTAVNSRYEKTQHALPSESAHDLAGPRSDAQEASSVKQSFWISIVHL